MVHCRLALLKMVAMSFRQIPAIKFLAALALSILGLLTSNVTVAQINDETVSQFSALQQQDIRLAIIAERQLSANAELCLNLMPMTGMVLHSQDQYGGDQLANVFALGPIAIAGLVPGSAAELAGLNAGDAILAINGQRTADLIAKDGAPLRDAVFDLIAMQPVDESLRLIVNTGSGERAIELPPRPGCKALVEIITGAGLVGRSDGRVIQVSYDLAVLLDDAGLAVIFAHELGHVVLDHRARLVDAGVSKGLLGEFGRNQRLNRQVEVEADRMSAHLLSNAGYDPQIASDFWRSTQGRSAGNGLLRSFIYPSHNSRADLIDEEMSNFLPLRTGPTWPGHLIFRRTRSF